MTTPSRSATDEDFDYVEPTVDEMLAALKKCGYNSFEELRNESLDSFYEKTYENMLLSMSSSILHYTRTKLGFRIKNHHNK